MTPLAAILRARIERDGPIPVADYMAEALGHPDYGYYMRADPLGAAGDFTTAPEITQMFGEILCVWAMAVWESMRRPGAVALVELGPGRGTLLADFLRAARARPAFHAALRLHLVEISPVLIDAQRRALHGHPVSWHDSFAAAAAASGATPLFVVANEFFDALPVHQLVRTARGWRERLVGLGANGEGFRFTMAEAETPLARLVPTALRDAAPGAIFELRPRAQEIARDIGAQTARRGGAALVIDYGHAQSATGETLQAVRHHRFHDVLADPGEADLTAHVDFAALAAAAAGGGARIFGPVPQGAFLRRLGIEARAAVLLRGASAAARRDIPAALRRLIAADEMGTLFKALAMTHPKLSAPPGFETRP